MVTEPAGAIEVTHCDLCGHAWARLCAECDTWCCKCGDGKVPVTRSHRMIIPQDREQIVRFLRDLADAIEAGETQFSAQREG